MARQQPAAIEAKPRRQEYEREAALKKEYLDTNNLQNSGPNLNLKKEKAIKQGRNTRKRATPTEAKGTGHDIKPT